MFERDGDRVLLCWNPGGTPLALDWSALGVDRSAVTAIRDMYGRSRALRATVLLTDDPVYVIVRN